MKVSVLFFASFRELMNTDQVELNLPESFTAGEVLDRVCTNEVRAMSWRRIMKLAVNDCYVAHDTPLKDGDVVAIIPPIAGG